MNNFEFSVNKVKYFDLDELAIPTKFGYLATDKSGRVFAYADKPECNTELGIWESETNNFYRVGKFIEEIDFNWTKSLLEIDLEMKVDYLGQTILVPAWTKWIAGDENGDIWAYEELPVIKHNNKGYWDKHILRHQIIYDGQSVRNPKWYCSLRPVSDCEKLVD